MASLRSLPALFVSDAVLIVLRAHTYQSSCLPFTAVYRIVRNQGNFGNVSVSWVVDPACTNDIYPEQGTVFFGHQEYSKNITIYSLPDEVNLFDMHTFNFYYFNVRTCGQGQTVGTKS